MSAATSSRSSAISSRSASAWSSERKRQDVQAQRAAAAEERVLDALVGANCQRRRRATLPQETAQQRARTTRKSRSRSPTPAELPMFEIPGMPGASMSAINLRRNVRQGFGGRTKTRRVTVEDSFDILIAEETDKLIDKNRSCRRRSRRSRITASSFSTRSTRSARAKARGGADVSREGVQRDLLPLIEGTTVATKHGPVKTDHILFIASARFTLPSRPTCCPNCRAACRSASNSGAVARRFPPHPDRAGSEPHQAVRGADGDRRRDARFHRRCHRCARRYRRRGEFNGGKYRRAATADGAWSGSSTRFRSRLRPLGETVRSTPPMSRRMSASWRRTPI